jgi:hypothetical protein
MRSIASAGGLSPPKTFPARGVNKLAWARVLARRRIREVPLSERLNALSMGTLKTARNLKWTPLSRQKFG